MSSAEIPAGFPPGADAGLCKDIAGLPLALYRGKYRKPAEAWALHYMERVAELEADVWGYQQGAAAEAGEADRLRQENATLRAGMDVACREMHPPLRVQQAGGEKTIEQGGYCIFGTRDYSLDFIHKEDVAAFNAAAKLVEAATQGSSKNG